MANSEDNYESSKKTVEEKLESGDLVTTCDIDPMEELSKILDEIDCGPNLNLVECNNVLSEEEERKFSVTASTSLNPDSFVLSAQRSENAVYFDLGNVLNTLLQTIYDPTLSNGIKSKEEGQLNIPAEVVNECVSGPSTSNFAAMKKPKPKGSSLSDLFKKMGAKSKETDVPKKSDEKLEQKTDESTVSKEKTEEKFPVKPLKIKIGSSESSFKDTFESDLSELENLMDSEAETLKMSGPEDVDLAYVVKVEKSENNETEIMEIKETEVKELIEKEYIEAIEDAMIQEKDTIEEVKNEVIGEAEKEISEHKEMVEEEKKIEEAEKIVNEDQEMTEEKEVIEEKEDEMKVHVKKEIILEDEKEATKEDKEKDDSLEDSEAYKFKEEFQIDQKNVEMTNKEESMESCKGNESSVLYYKDQEGYLVATRDAKKSQGVSSTKSTPKKKKRSSTPDPEFTRVTRSTPKKNQDDATKNVAGASKLKLDEPPAGKRRKTEKTCNSGGSKGNGSKGKKSQLSKGKQQSLFTYFKKN